MLTHRRGSLPSSTFDSSIPCRAVPTCGRKNARPCVSSGYRLRQISRRLEPRRRDEVSFESVSRKHCLRYWWIIECKGGKYFLCKNFPLFLYFILRKIYIYISTKLLTALTYCRLKTKNLPIRVDYIIQL